MEADEKIKVEGQEMKQVACFCKSCIAEGKLDNETSFYQTEGFKTHVEPVGDLQCLYSDAGVKT